MTFLPSASPALAARPLSLGALSTLPASLATPRYRLMGLKPGIVHIGVGNFHRAHMAIYLDELMRGGEALDFAIIGAGVHPSDASMRDRLKGQDYLYSVVEQDAGYEVGRVVGAMTDFIPVGDGHALVAAMADPAIRIVSLTITEGGYFLDAGGQFDTSHPAIRADAATPQAPTTAFGLILAALALRRARGLHPFAVMSCDNLPHNGKATRAALVGLADQFDSTLARFVETDVACPNAMVDRITPKTSEADIAAFAARHGIADAAPVFCEPFRQWVIEDQFPAGRPPFENAGATFVSDVTAHELMKIRMLNGGHAAIAYPAALLDITFVHEAMGHSKVRGFLEKLERTEIIPHVPTVPEMTREAYLTSLVRRFSNPSVRDTIRRLAEDGSNRQPKFIVASARDGLASGAPIDGLALASALWCRYCAGLTDSGQPIAPNDIAWSDLQSRARAAKSDPAAWLAMTNVYGELGQNERFAAAFAAAHRSLDEIGVEAMLARYIGS